MDPKKCSYCNFELGRLPRLSRFPYPVKSFGITHGWISDEVVSYGENMFEVTVRLASHKKKFVNYIAGKRYDTPFPHVQIKECGVETKYKTDIRIETFYFAYNPELEPVLKQILPFPDVPIWEMRNMEKESFLINELMGLMDHASEYGVVDRIDVLCFELLELLLFDCNYPRSAEKDFYRMKMQTVASYFQLHCRETIDLYKLLAYHGLSRSTFQRHWADYYKRTPGQYLTELRLREACRILKSDRNASSAGIAGELHFRNPAYFCALFRKHFGITPLAYHKLHYGED